MQPVSSPTEIFTTAFPLVSEPARVAACFDLDGTLAPIVDRPEDTAVPGRTRELLERISEKYLITAIVTGRQSLEAKRILGLDAITYVGNHGFEVLRPGESEPSPSPALAGQERVAIEFLESLDPERLKTAGLRTEDKAAIQALHWRGAVDQDSAEAEIAEIVAAAEAAGLHTHHGRKVLELRPPVELDKGKGIRALLEHLPLTGALYAGDDRTDVDGFEALAAMRDEGKIGQVLRIGVLSDETPEIVAEAADLTVAGPEGFVHVLEVLA